jgi:hypothetical protein
MRDLLDVLLPVSSVLIYIFLDHVIPEAWRKTKVTFTAILVLSAISVGIWQYYAKKSDSQEHKREVAEANGKIEKLQGEATTLKDLLQESRRENARLASESQEKIQAVRVDLAKAVSQEKARALQNQFSDWADDFIEHLPDKQMQFAQAKQRLQDAQAEAEREKRQMETQKQLAMTIRAYPVFSTTLTFINGLVGAYATKTHKSIRLDSTDLPDNFFSQKLERTIVFPGSAVWKFTISTPSQLESAASQTSLIGKFSAFDGSESGTFILSVLNNTDLVQVRYRSPFNMPDPSTIDGRHNLSNYESSLQRSLTKVVSAQLLQVENPSPTNSVTVGPH